jgi:5-methylcytosine-specific restriction endonuclease McrA
MGNFIDITGQKFGLLTVKSRHGRNNRGVITWLCLCDCGNEKILLSGALRNGTKSCGCASYYPRRIDISGRRFGRLTATTIAWIEKEKAWWECECDCGKTTHVACSTLTSGHTKSCGCLKSETSAIHCSTVLANRTKEKNPRWNPNLTDEERSARRRGELDLEWAKAIVRRDRYRCIVCSSNKKPQAHHLKSYTRYPELRLDMDNGVTLCRECHKKFHRCYGTTKFEREDFFNLFKIADPHEAKE